MSSSHAANYSPFQHLDPGIWKATKCAHITLTVIGTLLLAPAALVLALFWHFLQSGFSYIGDSEELLALGSALVGSISGGFAWCALCLLYFKRCDLRWQRVAWTTCAIFGYLTTPCILGWIIWFLNQSPGTENFILILLAILVSSASCMVLGHQNARLATRAQRRIQARLRC